MHNSAYFNDFKVILIYIDNTLAVYFAN